MCHNDEIKSHPLLFKKERLFISYFLFFPKIIYFI